MSIAEGQLAPAFTLPDAEGRPVSLGDFAGRNVIIYFYPRDETPGCTAEACAFRDLWHEIQSRGVTLVGVSPDSSASHARFAAKHGLPFVLLSDPEKKVLREYGAFGPKVSRGKQTEGVIRSTVWIGRDGKVVKRWPKVADAAEHPAQVLAALAA